MYRETADTLVLWPYPSTGTVPALVQDGGPTGPGERRPRASPCRPCPSNWIRYDTLQQFRYRLPLLRTLDPRQETQEGGEKPSTP